MVDETGQRPARGQVEPGKEGEIELLDIEECVIAETPKPRPQAKQARAAPISAPPVQAVPAVKHLKRNAWYASYGALTIAVMALVTVLLAGGLTAALRSTWPMRIAGDADGPDLRLSVETRV